MKSAALDPIFGSKYRLEKSLKNSKGIETFLAVNLENQRQVVIKIANENAISAQLRRKIEREVSSIKTAEFGTIAGKIYIAAPYIEGMSLEERIAGSQPLSISEVLLIGRSLAQALADLHLNEVIHHDVKPSNVIVDRGGPIQNVHLIDFGFSRSMRTVTPVDARPPDAAFYVSPEQAGLLGTGTDERSDLYSLGIILYECLTGRPPFVAPTMAEVLQLQLSNTPRLIRDLRPETPRALTEITERLLRKDPRDRYQSAESVKSDLALLSNLLDKGNPEPQIAVGHGDLRATLAEPSFIGRSEELEKFTRFLGNARDGIPGLVSVEALSGGGKSRLLEEFAKIGTREKVKVILGQGLDQSAPSPFQLLKGVAHHIIECAKHDPATLERIRASLGYHREAICKALPELRAPLGELSASEEPELFGETRSIQALGTLLSVLGTKTQPVVLIFDDCQWADSLTLQALSYWHGLAEKSQAHDHYVLVVLSFRTEEIPSGHSLRQMHPREHFILKPFDTTELTNFVESMTGSVPDEIIPLVADLSSGSPFMASAVVRGLTESSALVPTQKGWQVNKGAVKSIQASRRSGAFLVHRLELLPASTLKLLTSAAILGKEFDLDFALSLSKLNDTEATDALREAARRHFVWTRQDGRGTFVHDKIREALLSKLTNPEKQRLHFTAAQRLEEVNRETVFELAYHYDEAGDHRKAHSYALNAAKQARAQHSLEIAEQFYRIAQRGVLPSEREVKLEIAYSLGDVLMLRGQYDKAETFFQEARPLATGRVEQARIEASLGELAFKRGDVRTAAVFLEEALSILGKSVPKSDVAFLTKTLWEAFIQVLHTAFPRFFLSRLKRLPNEDEQMSLRIYSRLAYVYWFKNGLLPCAWTHLREMNLAESFLPSAELAQAYSEHAPVMTMLPYFSRGIKYAEKSLQIRKERGDLWGQGQSLHFLGVALYGSSKYHDVIEKCESAISLLERTGDRWEVHTAQWHLAYSHYRLGNLTRATELSKNIYRSGASIGDIQAMGISLAIWAKSTEGQIDKNLIDSALSRSQQGDVHTRAELLQAEAIRLLHQKQPETAVRILKQAQRMVEDASLRQEYVAPVLPWLTTALRMCAEAETFYYPHRREIILTEAFSTAKKALRLARFYKNNLPHALREYGVISAMRGQYRRARKALDESIKVGQGQYAIYEIAKSLQARGTVGYELSWAGAAEDLRKAKTVLDMIQATSTKAPPTTLALANRFDMITQVGREIATALSPQAVCVGIGKAVIDLSLGDECTLTKLDAQTKTFSVFWSNQNDPLLGTEIGKRALNEKQPLVFSEDNSQEIAESLPVKGVRSFVCLPIYVRGSPFGCLFIASRQLPGLFGNDHVRLCEYVSTLAGAALENSLGYEDLRGTNDKLVKTNKELEHFAYVASHDLQEPLRMIANFTELLSRKYSHQIDATGQKYLAATMDKSIRMQQLIRDLLAYSRDSNTKPELTDISIQTALNNSLELLKLPIEHSKAVITWDELPSVKGNEQLLVQLFQNLLSNSIKFRNGSSPKIHISAKKDGNFWRFSVKDNGIGIDPRYADSLFVIFRRLHRQDQYPGTGVGLALCKKVVELHGGNIWIGPVRDHGTTIYFTLPIK